MFWKVKYFQHLFHFFKGIIQCKVNLFLLTLHWIISYDFLISFFFFLMWTIFKVFIEFVRILLLFYALVLWPRGMWDLSSLTRDRTRTPCIGRLSLNHWTAREVPQHVSFDLGNEPVKQVAEPVLELSSPNTLPRVCHTKFK